jgi:pathogenesis-related protein 1
MKTITALSFMASFAILMQSAIASPISVAALNAHNSARVKDKQNPLIWSSDLEQISQKWVNQLARNCKVYHHRGQIPFGENLFISGGSASINQAISAWVTEKSFYNYAQNRCNPGKQCGHYTQIVWKGTTDVGCATQRCSNGSQIWACSYFPAGNIVGARPF